MKNPSNPPEERLHECDHLGPVTAYPYTSFEIHPDVDLREAMANEAVLRVMFAVNLLSFALHQKIDSIAEGGMVPEVFQEYRRHSGVLADLNVNKLTIAEDVTAKIFMNLPATLKDPESMLLEALTASGFCCDLMTDEMVADRVPHTIHHLAGFQREWLTMEFARNKEEKPFPIDRPSMVLMGQDIDGPGEKLGLALESALTMGPGRSVMTVVFDTPDDFQPPNHISLSGVESGAWVGVLRSLRSDS